MATVVNLGVCQTLAWVAWAHKIYSRSDAFHCIVSFYYFIIKVFLSYVYSFRYSFSCISYVYLLLKFSRTLNYKQTLILHDTLLLIKQASLIDFHTYFQRRI